MGAQTTQPPVFQLHGVGGPLGSGSLVKLADDWAVQVKSPKLLSCPGAELVSLRRVGKPLPAHPQVAQLVFANGDRVPLDLKTPPRLADDRLTFRPAPPLSADKGDLGTPVALVALVWLAAPQGVDDGPLYLRRLLAEKRSRDVLLLHSGDAVEGVVLALNPKTGCRLEVGKQTRDIPFGEVAVVAFSTELTTPGLPKKAYGRVVLGDGCRLSLAAATLDNTGAAVRGKTLFGAAVRFPVEELMGLEVRQGAAVYLSDLTPAKYEHTPFLGVGWPWGRDGGVTGRELRLKTGTHDKGVGLHAESRLTYKIDAKYRWFEALVGLDARTGTQGRARVRVLVDGQPRAVGADKELTFQNGPVTVRLDVAGAKELTLVVECGSRGDVQTHVNWADARLLP